MRIRRLALPAWVVVAGCVFVAVHAFRLAYTGSKGAAIDMGVPIGSAGSYPWCIEGAIVVAATATLALPKGERRLAWFVLYLMTTVSGAANVLHALDVHDHRSWSPAFAIIPPLVLPLCVRLAERVAMATWRTLTETPSVALTVPPGPVSDHRPPPVGRTPAVGPDGQADDTPALPPPAVSLTVTNPPPDRQAAPPDRHRQTVGSRRTAGHRTARPSVAVTVMTVARDHHAQHGEWPSPATLMTASGASESTVTRALKQLRAEANGHHTPAGVP